MNNHLKKTSRKQHVCIYRFLATVLANRDFLLFPRGTLGVQAFFMSVGPNPCVIFYPPRTLHSSGSAEWLPRLLLPSSSQCRYTMPLLLQLNSSSALLNCGFRLLDGILRTSTNVVIRWLSSICYQLLRTFDPHAKLCMRKGNCPFVSL